MNKQELAKLLNGRKIGEEISRDEEKQASLSNLVVIYGASDDLAEICGAINDECSAYGDNVIPFFNGELLTKECEDDTCPHELRLFNLAKIVKPIWCKDNISWTYETDIPHETFDILEDDEIFCRGIVFDLKDIK